MTPQRRGGLYAEYAAANDHRRAVDGQDALNVRQGAESKNVRLGDARQRRQKRQ